jgi:hypothetical protein
LFAFIYELDGFPKFLRLLRIQGVEVSPLSLTQLSKCAIASKLKLSKVSGPLGLFKELVPFLH